MTDGTYPLHVDIEDVGSLRAQEQAYFALAQSARALLDAVVRTRVEPSAARASAAELDAVTARLLQDAHPGPVGMQPSSDGILRDHANPAVGRRNPIAPPLQVDKDRQAQTTRTQVDLGAGYEGPPGHVHGGVIALILDQVLGTVPPLVGLPAMTAYLNLTYVRPTPLGRVGAHAVLERREGRKILVRGAMTDENGDVTVEAEGLFVVPRAYVEALADGSLPAQPPPSDVGEFPVSAN